MRIRKLNFVLNFVFNFVSNFVLFVLFVLRDMRLQGLLIAGDIAHLAFGSANPPTSGGSANAEHQHDGEADVLLRKAIARDSDQGRDKGGRLG